MCNPSGPPWYCDMTDKNGVPVISHDTESRTLVQECETQGCYSRDIDYTGASLYQLASLTRVSTHCEQLSSMSVVALFFASTIRMDGGYPVVHQRCHTGVQHYLLATSAHAG